jgi:hypothetical protein
MRRERLAALSLALLCANAPAVAAEPAPKDLCGRSCVATASVDLEDREARAALTAAEAAELTKRYPKLEIVARCRTETGWGPPSPRTALTLVAPKKADGTIVRLLADGTGHFQLLAKTKGANTATYPGKLFFGEQRCLSAAEARDFAAKLGCPGHTHSSRCDFHSDVSTPAQAHPSVCFMTGAIGGPDDETDWECWGYNPKAEPTVFSRWLESRSID